LYYFLSIIILNFCHSSIAAFIFFPFFIVSCRLKVFLLAAQASHLLGLKKRVHRIKNGGCDRNPFSTFAMVHVFYKFRD
jgi:hypothetical protein